MKNRGIKLINSEILDETGRRKSILRVSVKELLDPEKMRGSWLVSLKEPI